MILTDNININNINDGIEYYLGLITNKNDNDTYSVLINDITHTNVNSLSKLEYNVGEEVIILFVSDIYFIIGSNNTKHEYIEKQDIKDTGWKDLPLSNLFVPYDTANYKPMYRVIGSMVYFRGAIKPKNPLNPTGVGDEFTVCNLPKECQTPGARFNFTRQGSGFNTFVLNIVGDKATMGRYSAGGTLTTPIPTTAWLTITCSYCTNDDMIL